jgi:hypothetical protein
MNKKIFGAALGLAILAASSVASARTDVVVGVGVPGVYAPARAVVVGPTPVAYGYGPEYRGDWRARRAWEHREWERRQWREHHEYRRY